jgi:hypothetical protein
VLDLSDVVLRQAVALHLVEDLAPSRLALQDAGPGPEFVVNDAVGVI